MSGLAYSIEAAGALDPATVAAMFGLYSRYYEATSETLFRRDLAKKNYAILLRDDAGALQGFSTAALRTHRFEGETLRSFFSGDTIVEQAHWGQQALPAAWFRLTGHLKALAPETPLYWFLLVKGHRTYRYLPTFFRSYFPAHDRETPPREAALMAMLARDRFPEAYDAGRGVVSFTTSQGHLRPAWAAIPDKDRRRPLVRYFLERNPGYVAGDELVCLAELSSENLRPLAARMLRLGMEAGI